MVSRDIFVLVIFGFGSSIDTDQTPEELSSRHRINRNMEVSDRVVDRASLRGIYVFTLRQDSYFRLHLLIRIKRFIKVYEYSLILYLNFLYVDVKDLRNVWSRIIY